MAKVSFTNSLNDEYQRLFDTCRIRDQRATEVNGLVKRLVQNQERYTAVSAPLGIPWFFVGVVHGMEASFKFTGHLHNGDPLTARTVQEPPGRPRSGEPPFTWEESATDALLLKKLDQVTDWSLPRVLYKLEEYNGFGYRAHHPEVLTPYLWSFSEHYSSGKYVADGTFSPSAVSKQCGAAVLLRRMAETNVITFHTDGTPVVADVSPSPSPFDEFGPLIRFSTTKSSDAAAELQQMLNTIPGIFVKVDGVPGQRTSDAFKKLTGHFLIGDPRAD